MRKLIDVPNTDGASSDYPKGNVRDKAGLTAGTTGGALLFADIIQLFQKLVIDAGITENTLPDNVSNGYQLLDALVSKINNTSMFKKTINIGNWDMDATANVNIAHGLDFTKIRRVSVIIIKDDLNSYFDLGEGNNGAGGDIGIDITNITITRKNTGKFDSTDYNDATINRGYIVIDYIA